jgi:hypothetical protein
VPNVKHTMKEAVAIQQAFEERFCGSHDLKAVGVCLNPRTGDLALHVQVSKMTEAAYLPRSFDGLEVLVDVVGAVHALER